MTAPELFGVAIRVTAFWITLYGLYCLFWGIALGYCTLGRRHQESEHKDAIWTFFLAGLAGLLAGSLIMSSATKLVEQCYQGYSDMPPSGHLQPLE